MKVNKWSNADRVEKSLGSNRVLRISYRKANGESTIRDIEPVLSYTCHLGCKVVIAYCRLRDNYRSFRVDRIKTSLLKYNTYSPEKHTNRFMDFVVDKSGDLTNVRTMKGVVKKIVSKYDVNVMNV